MHIISRKALQTHWQVIEPMLTIHNEDEYDQAVERLNSLIDEIGTDEAHPLYNLMDTLGILVHTYDEIYYQIPVSSGIGTLKYLMDEHGLEQADLLEIGSPSIISDILLEKRQLNTEQIRSLSQRFGVSPAVFF